MPSYRVTATRHLCVLVIGFGCVAALLAEPSATTSPTASPAVSESPARRSRNRFRSYLRNARRLSVPDLPGRRDYSKWLDQVAKNSGSEFLQRPVFDRVTWMRLLASVGGLALFQSWPAFLWIVRRRAGTSNRKNISPGSRLARRPFENRSRFLFGCAAAPLR